jgi:hypothetical protein
VGARDEHLVAQGAAAFVAQGAAERAAAQATAVAAQDQAFGRALEELRQARAFVEAPAHILGNPVTKHGEIAEQVEVAVRNARDLVAQRLPTATFEGVGRLDATDYRIGADAVQSKFINGAARTLDHVHEHLRDHPGYGAKGTFYHIPRDHHEAIQKALAGEPVDGLRERTLRALVEKARELEQATGRPFAEVVRPSVSEYRDVQQGNVHATLDRHEGDVRDAHQDARETAGETGQATLGDVAGAAAKGAAIGAGVRIVTTLHRKRKEGKSLLRGDLTLDDWKDVGFEGLKGGAQGGVAAGAIFALTKCADTAAPFAGAMVSSAMATAELVRSHRRGEIAFDEMVELGELACSEAAMIGVAAAVGQAVIPIPVLGALVGTFAGRFLANHGRRLLSESDQRLAHTLEERFQKALSALDREQQATVTRLVADFDRLGELTEAAFDVERNAALRLGASVKLAEAHGVAAERIVRDTADLDRFMLG